MLRLAIPRRAPAVRSRGSRAQNTSGPGVRQPGSPAGKTSRRGQDLPRFPGNPRGPMPCSSTPAGPVAPRRSGTPIWPPCCPRRRLQRVVLSRLNRTALALTVYASSSPLRCRRRKTRFRWLARPCRVGLATHRVATKGFKDASSSPPLLSFAWRKDSLRILFLGIEFGKKPFLARRWLPRPAAPPTRTGGATLHPAPKVFVAHCPMPPAYGRLTRVVSQQKFAPAQLALASVVGQALIPYVVGQQRVRPAQRVGRATRPAVFPWLRDNARSDRIAFDVAGTTKEIGLSAKLGDYLG